MIYEIVKTSAKFADSVKWNGILPMVLTANDGSGEAQFKTICKMAYNEDGIFFRFEAEDDKIQCTMTEYNAPIYDEEPVEIFLQPDKDDLTHYTEFEWNAIGGVFAAKVTNDLKGKTSLDFYKQNIIDSKIFAMENGWKIQGFLPKELFDKELVGEWKFNAYRIKRRKDNSMILMSYSNTIAENFHIPAKFATLKFI